QYANRMSFLAETGTRLRQLAKRALLVRAEDLIGEPRSVLSQLQRFLHLRSPLDEHYSVFDRRGAWNLSDTSNFIRKGKIERERPPHAEISPPDQLADT